MRKRFDKIKIKRKLNEAEKDIEEKERDIISSYKNGEPVKSISSRYGISLERVYQYLRRNGLSSEARRQHINIDTLNRAVASYINNLETTKIEAAKEFNIPLKILDDYLESNNIKKDRKKYNKRTILHLYIEMNLTSNEVAKQLGLDLKLLRGYINREGITKGIRNKQG
ncbi:IS630 transposase-related protein [Pseudomonas aeruginosa]|uniref:IS630 transposase-related protein n=1 Tax=Pseudomonas aeruginosa TaxID=287 RepID=UPI0021E3599A|nr:IS630 transposase-related protein [Pseudomonas aeruginosa]UYF86565.1 IS630 transposase-related protein [Pseudomonas aeruginosa]